MDVDEYCRELEAHLCRRNEGHLVRISGPAFDTVRGWAAMGVPLKVAFQGIDRHLERVNAKGPRRRPVRIEFCEADVLDAFDAWRRAVGVRATVVGEGGEEGEVDLEAAPRRRQALSTHIDRVIVRLTALRTGPSPWSDWDAALDDVVGRLDALHPSARHARGSARDAVVAELAALDARLIDVARATIGDTIAADVAREADGELEPFRSRMTSEAYGAAHQRCVERIVRERLALPVLTID
ncbi:MAG: hypothetical protein NTV05_04205 [Acidobacteria bacterium]|nr:hypothetical protein [Acidobacteriota bacterium]